MGQEQNSTKSGKWKQIDERERYEIEALLKAGHSNREIAQVNVLLRNPEERKNFVFTFAIVRWENQHKGGDVRGAGKIQPTVTNPSL